MVAQTSTPPPAKPATVAKPATPVTPATPASKPAVKPAAKPAVQAKAAEEPKIAGTEIKRADGTYLGLELSGGNFKLSFYDAKKMPMDPDVTRATARWPNTRGPGDNRTVLNPSGRGLIGNKPVLPPFTFTVYITLLKEEGGESKAVESFSVPFRG